MNKMKKKFASVALAVAALAVVACTGLLAPGPSDGAHSENEKIEERGGAGESTGITELLIVLAVLFGGVATLYASNSKEARAELGPSQKAKERAAGPVVSDKRFSDVVGLSEVKRDVECLVDFLKNREKYEDAGAKLPRGVVLYGPPGTGKTLLAKAIAGEAGVPFLYMSGSEFVEMYVGVGAKRVRELFQRARRQAPCIVFIDEIDAVGAKRSDRENSEDRKTLNALLTEMDGFRSTDNVLVIGATNRLADLDPALLRPGRFTNKYCVPLPETKADRLAIVEHYASGKRFGEDVDFSALAKETAGFSPAQIEALVNESAIASVSAGRGFITRADVDTAYTKMALDGHIRDDQSERDPEEVRAVAWHEAGHALVGKLCGDEITKVTVLSTTSGAGGFTVSAPKGRQLRSAQDLKNAVAKLYGGRCAEKILFGHRGRITTGASNDIERATKIIRSFVVNYGLVDEYGLLNLEVAEAPRGKVLDKEIELAKEIESAADEMLGAHINELRAIADELLENTTLYGEDLDRIMSHARATSHSAATT